ncbi:MAG: hypothetical protein ABII88_07490 [Candidatus Omnitrophota bacterium]
MKILKKTNFILIVLLMAGVLLVQGETAFSVEVQTNTLAPSINAENETIRGLFYRAWRAKARNDEKKARQDRSPDIADGREIQTKAFLWPQYSAARSSEGILFTDVMSIPFGEKSIKLPVGGTSGRSLGDTIELKTGRGRSVLITEIEGSLKDSADDVICKFSFTDSAGEDHLGHLRFNISARGVATIEKIGLFYTMPETNQALQQGETVGTVLAADQVEVLIKFVLSFQRVTSLDIGKNLRKHSLIMAAAAKYTDNSGLVVPQLLGSDEVIPNNYDPPIHLEMFEVMNFGTSKADVLIVDGSFEEGIGVAEIFADDFFENRRRAILVTTDIDRLARQIQDVADRELFPQGYVPDPGVDNTESGGLAELSMDSDALLSVPLALGSSPAQVESDSVDRVAFLARYEDPDLLRYFIERVLIAAKTSTAEARSYIYTLAKYENLFREIAFKRFGAEIEIINSYDGAEPTILIELQRKPQKDKIANCSLAFLECIGADKIGQEQTNVSELLMPFYRYWIMALAAEFIDIETAEKGWIEFEKEFSENMPQERAEFMAQGRRLVRRIIAENAIRIIGERKLGLFVNNSAEVIESLEDLRSFYLFSDLSDAQRKTIAGMIIDEIDQGTHPRSLVDDKKNKLGITAEALSALNHLLLSDNWKPTVNALLEKISTANTQDCARILSRLSVRIDEEHGLARAEVINYLKFLFETEQSDAVVNLASLVRDYMPGSMPDRQSNASRVLNAGKPQNRSIVESAI